MRSLLLKSIVAAGVALALAGCLVSEEPVLDERTGKATPLRAGPHQMCPVGEDADDDDCEEIVLSVDETGLYSLSGADGEGDETMLRFRRIARGGYAVQAHEDDGYVYYYGRGDHKRFELVMMICGSLSAKTRDRLLARSDLESDDEDFETCVVKSLRGLKAAARDYHFGRASDSDEAVFAFTPLPAP